MFLEISQKVPVPETLLNKVAGLRPKACNFIKKWSLAQGFSCEFCEISKKKFFTEQPWCLLLLFKLRRAPDSVIKIFSKWSKRTPAVIINGCVKAEIHDHLKMIIFKIILK